MQFEVQIQQNHSARKSLDLTPPNSSPKSPDEDLGNRRKRLRSCSDDEDWRPQNKSPKEPPKRKVNSPSSYSSKLSKKVPRVPVILKSFGRSQGAGEQLQDLLPNHEDNADGVAAFLLFVYERQMIWKRKYRGKRQTLTENNVLSTQWFTNMYR